MSSNGCSVGRACFIGLCIFHMPEVVLITVPVRLLRVAVMEMGEVSTVSSLAQRRPVLLACGLRRGVYEVHVRAAI